MKKAVPKADMIFLEMGREKDSDIKNPIPQHFG
jgi:hypothetical protein